MAQMPSIERGQLLAIIEQWHEGSLTEAQVQEYAESVTDECDFPELPHADDDSIAIEVLLYLDTLPGLLVTTQDIPEIFAFLRTPPGDAHHGWERWLAYWKSVDHEQRRKDLDTNPFYFT